MYVPVFGKTVTFSNFPGITIASVPLCLSTKAMLITLLTVDASIAASTSDLLPNIARRSILTTRPFRRVL